MVCDLISLWQYLPINELWKTCTGKAFKSPFFRPRGNCHFDKARNQTEFLLKFRSCSAEAKNTLSIRRRMFQHAVIGNS